METLFGALQLESVMEGSSGGQAEGYTYLPGTASLVQEIDSKCVCVFAYSHVITWLVCTTERMLIVLRDGRTLIGFLRSVDQFGQ